MCAERYEVGVVDQVESGSKCFEALRKRAAAFGGHGLAGTTADSTRAFP